MLLLPGNFLFGWAKPVPVDSRNMRSPRSNMVWVSAAGPAANLLMAIFWAFLMMLSQNLDLGVASQWIGAMAAIGIFINILLAVFNLLPIPPLDGGQLLINLLRRGPVSSMLESVAPWGLFIVLGLLVTGVLFRLLSGPIFYLQHLLIMAFGL
jgi:Zn-dependent protease